MRTALRLALLFLSALTLAAQPYGSDRDRAWGRTGRVILYADPNFEGQGLELYPGDEFPDLRDLAYADGRRVNDRISSIRIEGPAKLRVFTDPNFNGDRIDITGDVADLRRLARSKDGRISWDDCITALQVDGPRRPAMPDRERDRDRGREERRSTPRVVVYADPNFEGEGLAIEAGDDIPDLRRAPFGNGMKSNDKISSIRVEGGARARFYADPNFNGDVLDVGESIADLRLLRRGQWTWDDCITGVRVERASGRGPGNGRPPGGGRPPARDPEPMIRKIYQELLGQAPDPMTLSRYRRLVIEENWSEDMLRSDVMTSAEYRNREADRVIRRLFREMLGREPDPTGYENFRRKIVDWGWSENDVRNAIRRSDEFRRRQSGPQQPQQPPQNPPGYGNHRPRESGGSTSEATAPEQR